MNKNTKTQKECDRLWQEIQMIVWGCRCAKCLHEGVDVEAEGLGAHHIVSKGSAPIRIRHDIDDGVLFCWPHHQWAENNPNEFHAWLCTYHLDRWSFWYSNRNAKASGTILSSVYDEVLADLKIRREALNHLMLSVTLKGIVGFDAVSPVHSVQHGKEEFQMICSKYKDVEAGRVCDALGNVIAGVWQRKGDQS